MGGEGGLGFRGGGGGGGGGNGRGWQGFEMDVEGTDGIVVLSLCREGDQEQERRGSGGRILLDNAADGRRRMRSAQARCRDA